MSPVIGNITGELGYTNFTETAVAIVENFLIKFFKIYPNLSLHDFYIFGESYAGRFYYLKYFFWKFLFFLDYVPALAARLARKYKENP